MQFEGFEHAIFELSGYPTGEIDGYFCFGRARLEQKRYGTVGSVRPARVKHGNKRIKGNRRVHLRFL